MPAGAICKGNNRHAGIRQPGCAPPGLVSSQNLIAGVKVAVARSLLDCIGAVLAETNRQLCLIKDSGLLVVGLLL